MSTPPICKIGTGLVGERDVQHIAPSARGLVFHKCVEAHDEAVCSLIWLPLLEDIDLSDKTSLPARLWDAALDYIATLPGCGTILWGHCLYTAKPEILLLVRWQSTFAWGVFQQTAGFSILLVTGLIRGNPFNRAVYLDSATWNAIAADKMAEITLFTIHRSVRDDGVAGLKEQLAHRHTLVARMGAMSASTWMAERLVASNPTAVHFIDLADTLPNILVDLTVWHDESDFLATVRCLESQQIDGSETIRSFPFFRLIARLESVPGRSTASTSTPSLAIPASASSVPDLLALLPFARQRGWFHVGKPRSKFAIFSSAPRMASMHEYHTPELPILPLVRKRGPDDDPPFTIQAIQLRFDPKVERLQQDPKTPPLVTTLVSELSKRLEELECYRTLMAFEVQSKPNTFEVFICRSSPSSCPSPGKKERAWSID